MRALQIGIWVGTTLWWMKMASGQTPSPMGIQRTSPGSSLLLEDQDVQLDEPVKARLDPSTTLRKVTGIRKKETTLHREQCLQFPPRNIFLNGVNISSLRAKDLQGVDIQIDEEGNIHISSDAYVAREESHFSPLLPTEWRKYNKQKTMPGTPPSAATK